jgi:hypothetical protein
LNGNIKIKELKEEERPVKSLNDVQIKRLLIAAVTQRLLEHSSPNLTNKVYTNVNPVLRHVVEQLQVSEWL